ncbi:MAG: malonyl-ACP O-methyltransferase BioC [Gammaproteobacteria bacterium]|nr:malonyl-ACP O-methyltransferase BioC [Gammaproteobacteria bacterium]
MSDQYQRIRRAFSAASQSYEQAAVLQREVCGRLTERLSDIEKQAEWILDIGAGTGTSTRALHQQYPNAECVALDFAYPMLQHLKQHSERIQKPRIVCADASNLPFCDSQFDLVFSSLTFQWCHDLAGVFNEVRRVLAPNGLFLFATLGPDTLYELRNSWAAVDDAVHVNHFLDMHHVGDALLHAGFANPVVDVERIVLTQQSVDVLLRDLKALGANTVIGKRRHGLTGHRRLQAMRREYERFRTAEGNLPATFEVVFGMANQANAQHPLRYFSTDSFKKS